MSNQPGANDEVPTLSKYLIAFGVAAAMFVVVLLPLNLLSWQRLHHDEALYATWALQITSGDDPWLSDTPIDKPPLFLYLVAGAIQLAGHNESATRLPSLLATVLTVGLTFWLGQRLYSAGVGLLAAWLVALSPFVLLFAPTAFTDPVLVALVLAGCVAATYRQTVLAGIFLALAIATKQQGIFFFPLVLGVLFLTTTKSCKGEATRRIRCLPQEHQFELPRPYLAHNLPPIIKFIITLALTLLPFLIWDFNREQPSAFFEQSYLNYGGLFLDVANFKERWAGFADLLAYGPGSPLLNGLLVIGCPWLLLHGSHQLYKARKSIGLEQSAFMSDLWLALFSLLFFLWHTILSFQVWDRYLLGLVPLLALLLGRVLLWPWQILQRRVPAHRHSWLNGATTLILAGILMTAQIGLVQDAIKGRYPLGSNSRSIQGIEQIVAYLQGNVGANSTLYHHWLGTHWRFYLWHYPYDLQFWQTPAELAGHAKAGQYLAYPTWRSDTAIRIALVEAGFQLVEVSRAYSVEGAPSIILYQIKKVE